MSIYKCTLCSYSTASHWLLREHELNHHVNDIKIDPKNPKAPTTVSFGPDVAKAPTKIHVSHSGAVQRGFGVDDVDMSSDTESDTEDENEILKMKVILKISSMKIKICWKLLMISNQHLITVGN